jgi:enoyl-CoA hydratase/carnithine racemase
MTICNAGKANILSRPAIDGPLQGFRQSSGDSTVRILILTASGERAFIGGGDLKEMSKLHPSSAELLVSKLGDLCEAARRFPAPVAARIAGWRLGGGLEIAMARDLRIASSNAKFAMPEVAVGIPSVIHAALLPRLVGRGRARGSF